MMKWLWELFDDPKIIEAKLLKQLLRESPELPEWSSAVQPVLTRLLTSNQIQRPMFFSKALLRRGSARTWVIS
jgi:hypothetical protein